MLAYKKGTYDARYRLSYRSQIGLHVEHNPRFRIRTIWPVCITFFFGHECESRAALLCFCVLVCGGYAMNTCFFRVYRGSHYVTSEARNHGVKNIVGYIHTQTQECDRQTWQDMHIPVIYTCV
jgi:hypothetical protein